MQTNTHTYYVLLRPCPTLLPEPTLARCVHLVRHVPQKKRGVESIQTVYNASIESSEQPDFFSTVRWFYHVKGQRQVSRPLSKTRFIFALRYWLQL